MSSRHADTTKITTGRDHAVTQQSLSRLIEDRTGWTIKQFVRTARRYRTVNIRAGQHVLTAEDPLPNELRDALALIT